MNQPVEISSLTEYIDVVEQITDPDVIFLYRGQENAEWKITSSAYRRLKKQIDIETRLLERQDEDVETSSYYGENQ